jgi:ABC-type multidrug transport system fused ATPase/permease subunit
VPPSACRARLVIAHRFNTVQSMDRLVLLERGRIAAEGLFHDLAGDNARLREMVAALGIQGPGSAPIVAPPRAEP